MLKKFSLLDLARNRSQSNQIDNKTPSDEPEIELNLEKSNNDRLKDYSKTTRPRSKGYSYAFDDKPIEKSNNFEPDTVKLFLQQDCNRIRAKNKKFEDPYFLKYITSIVENTNSQLFVSLKTRLKVKTLKELNDVIGWQRIEVHI